MRLAIFGATGRVGRALMSRALRDGHHVKALVRGNGALAPAEQVQVLEGDVLDLGAVSRVVDGVDAVLSSLGVPDPARPGSLLEQGMRTVTEAMRLLGVRRVIAVAGAGILDAPTRGLRHDQPDFPVQYRPISEAHLGTWRALDRSRLDWTLVCTPTQTDEPPRGKWQESADVLPEGSGEIAIADIADFISRLVLEPRYHEKRVGICY